MSRSTITDKLRNSVRERFDKQSRVLLKNSSWVFIANGIGAGYAFLRSIIIARGLGVEILGQYTIAIAFVLTVQELIKLNVAGGVIRFGSQFRSENRPDKIVALIKTCVTASMISAVFSVIVVAVLTLAFYSHFISTPGLAHFIILYAVVNGIGFLDPVGKGVLNLYYKFKVNSAVQITMDTVEFLMVASCIWFFRSNLQYFFITVIITRLANSLICNFSVLYELRSELGPYLTTKMNLIKGQYREVANYVIGNSFSNTLRTFMNQGDVLLLSHWAGPAAVGLYAVAKKLAYSVLTLTDPLVTSIFPQLSVLVFKKNYHELKIMLRKITLFTLIPAALALIVGFIFREQIITAVYGIKFADAANPFFIHLAGAIQGAVFFWTLPLINSMGLTGLRFRIYIIAMITGVIVSLITVSTWGASGVAAGLLAANLCITGLFTWFAFRFIQKDQEHEPEKINGDQPITSEIL